MTKYLKSSLLALMFLFASTAAMANDQIVATVTNGSGPQATIVNNGVPSGTIQLWYNYVGLTLPCGQFSTFNLGLVDQTGNGGQVPSYPVTLNLAQSGNGTPVQLSPYPSSYSVSGLGWADSSLVTVTIDCSKLGDPFDGQTIDGNLNVNTVPSGAKLNTISTIQVHIKLVIPAPTACLKLYSFESDQDTGTLVTGVSVVAPRSTVRSTSPGTLSADGLVVNACQEQKSFDLLIGLDPNWQTIPNNNPGNATFTYTLAGELDPSTLGILGSGTPQGQVLCLRNVVLPAGDSFLATVHSAIKDGLNTANLPADHTFDFSAAVYAAGSSCTGSPLGSDIVGPNDPATSTLSF